MVGGLQITDKRVSVKSTSPLKSALASYSLYYTAYLLIFGQWPMATHSRSRRCGFVCPLTRLRLSTQPFCRRSARRLLRADDGGPRNRARAGVLG